MTICLLKSKIHRAAVTGASVDYEGSLTIARDLAERVGLRAYEKILVGNLENGERFETYCIYGATGSGVIELNGATAHLGKIGDRLTIMSYGQYSPVEADDAKPAVLLLDETNAIVRESGTLNC
jgi:aspartate 1-decarboxylase